jgi:hypothetical protein
MRIQLAAAVALAPLMMASGAAAQTVISTERTTPISTSTANNGNPDAIRIANGGLIRLSSGTAVTIDSSHGLTLDTGSRILMETTANGTTGVLVMGGNTANIVNNGSIIISETYTGTDSDNDGDLDGDFAQGSNRYGLRVVGPGALTGDIHNDGLIEVEGNQSTSLSIETDLVGNLLQTGTLNMLGDHSYGLRTTGTISGNVYNGGAVNVLGEGTIGVSIEGAVGGRLTFGGTIVASGFRYTTSLTAAQIRALDADDLLIGGPAVNIAANITGGILFDTRYLNNASDDDDDDDGIPDTTDTDSNNNGVLDTDEGASDISSYGSAPAVQVGSTTQTVSVGVVGTGEDAYGFINRGAILGSGVYSGIDGVLDPVNSTAVRIGVDGGLAVTIDGGLRNAGSITALANEGNASALVVGANATLATINNQSVIRALSAGEAVNQAVAIDYLAGSTGGTLVNSGTIGAYIQGEAGNATAIRDASGTLTSLTNSGIIEAVITPTDATADEITGRTVAIDLSANTSGVTLTQVQVDEDLDPTIVGDILLGSGADVVQINAGTVIGALEFGAGADSLVIDGGAVVTGALSDTDGLLDIDVTEGVLDARQVSALTVSGLNLGADGSLIVTLDPTAGTTGGFNVNGTATIDSVSNVGVRFTSLVDDPTRFVVVQATNLAIVNPNADPVEITSPFMIRAFADYDAALNQVYVDARQRTSSEFGFIAAEADTYGAFYEALAGDTELLNAFLSQSDRDSFFDMYQQTLPEHSGGALMSLATGVDAVTRALSGRGHPAPAGETSAWLQEINFYADREQDQAYGFRSEGFGFAGGVERGSGFGALGLSFALTSSDLEDPESRGEEILSAQLLELGLYWRAQGTNWNVWARGAGGFASFDSVRQLVAPGINRRSRVRLERLQHRPGGRCRLQLPDRTLEHPPRGRCRILPPVRGCPRGIRRRHSLRPGLRRPLRPHPVVHSGGHLRGRLRREPLAAT